MLSHSSSLSSLCVCCVCVCVCVLCVCDFAGDSEEVSLFQFMESVASVIPDKWRRVGVALGIRHPQINAINTQHQGDAVNCFESVFHFWQQQSTPQQPVSWTTLVTVLRSHYVGEERLADSIKANFLS